MHDLLDDVDTTAQLRRHRHRRIRALREHHRALPLLIRLGQPRNRRRDRLDIVLCRDAMRLRVRRGLGLVADQDVDVGEHGVERVFEELRDKGRGEVEDEELDNVLAK